MANDSPTDEAVEQARTFCADSGWEAELKDFGNKKMLRFVTKRAITSKDVRVLVKFLSSNENLNDKVYHVHTGAHCTEDGKIGTTEPDISLFDIQKIFGASLRAGVMQI